MKSTTRVLGEAGEMLLSLKGDLQKGLFEPASQLRLAKDLDVRKNLKFEIQNQRFNLLNRRQ
jgi:hypothetical protein